VNDCGLAAQDAVVIQDLPEGRVRNQESGALFRDAHAGIIIDIADSLSALDHILPKGHYPALAVAPLNLVAACMECNKLKLDVCPATAGDTFLHPYFDDISGDNWLTADVIEQRPCAVVFDVDPPGSWGGTLSARMRHQFELLKLAELYSREAAREISNIRYNLQRHFNAGGREAVRQELRRQWQSRRVSRLNSWQTATYKALSDSAWFCDKGFAY